MKLNKKLKKIMKNEPLRIIVGLAIFLPALLLEHLGFKGLALGMYITALVLSGAEVFIGAVRGIIRGDLLDERFLMSAAAIGAMIIGESEEGVAVMLFYLVGEYFQHVAVRRSRTSIKSLMQIRPDTATVLSDDGKESEEDAEDVEIGTTVIVRSGERIPIDATVIDGACDVDNSALTGESVPVAVNVGDTVLSGGVVLGGVIKCVTLRSADSSAAARVLELVESASERKSRTEAFITRFSRVYTPIVFGLAVLMGLIPSVFGWLTPADAIYRALSFLVVSCPCALVISVPMAFFGGIGGAASRGILYKGGSIFSPLARAGVVAFDKTGTLTEGRLTVAAVASVALSEGELLTLAASAEYHSNHPVAEALKASAPEIITASNLVELSGRGVTATVGTHTVAVGNSRLLDELRVSYPSADGVLVAVDGAFAGSITFRDTVKPEAREAISALRSLGVGRIVMISGDRRESAQAVADELGLDDVYSELLPEGKLDRLERLTTEHRAPVVYVGDGINDAPCLARADVGIAMGTLGTDSAIEAADAVIMSDNLVRLPTAIKIARKTERIARENIVFALAVKLAVLALVSVGISGMWMAVFADVGVAVLAILNSFRTLIGSRRRDD